MSAVLERRCSASFSQSAVRRLFSLRPVSAFFVRLSFSARRLCSVSRASFDLAPQARQVVVHSGLSVREVGLLQFEGGDSVLPAVFFAAEFSALFLDLFEFRGNLHDLAVKRLGVLLRL